MTTMRKSISQQASQGTMHILMWISPWHYTTCPWRPRGIVTFSQNWERPTTTWWNWSRLWQLSPSSISPRSQVITKEPKISAKKKNQELEKIPIWSKWVSMELRFQGPQNTLKYNFLELSIWASYQWNKSQPNGGKSIQQLLKSKTKTSRGKYISIY